MDSGAQSSHRTGWSLRGRRPLLFVTAALALLTISYLSLANSIPNRLSFLSPDKIPHEAMWGDIGDYTNATYYDPRPDYRDDLQGTFAYDDDHTHILVPEPSSDTPPPFLRPITDRLPYHTLSSFYKTGSVPSTKHPKGSPQMDIVYLWVNSSDPLFGAAKGVRGEQEGIKMGVGENKRFRDNGELRGAMRSAVSSLGDGLGRLHVLSGDYPFDQNQYSYLLPGNNQTEDGVHVERWRMGQVPEWMDWDVVRDDSMGIKWHFHSSVFRIPRDELEQDEEEKEIERKREEEWREASIPNFNSFAIESRVGWIPGLSENFVLSNDDMFMLSNMTTADFHHALLGNVFRLDGSFPVKPVVTPDLKSTMGEWGGLQHASLLVSKRFPSKSRGYMHHLPKTLSVSLAQEATVIWEHELSEASTRGFRTSTRGLADVEMSWLVSYLRVERWREALLWTWAVARVGGLEGIWRADAREEVRKVLGLSKDMGDVNVLVKRGKRTTTEDIKAMSLEEQWDLPLKTAYVFSSMDGHLPVRPDKPEQGATCMFFTHDCLPSDFFANPHDNHSAADVFTHLTFVRPECGDCLIKALVTASGPRGLSAFLPDPELVFYPPKRPRQRWEGSEPILPMTSTWRAANFTMDNVVGPGQDRWEGTPIMPNGGVNLQQWCIKLLSRYSYVTGTTDSHFALIHSLRQLQTAIDTFDNNPQIAMACLNDDQPDGGFKGVGDRFADWMQERWGEVDVNWERDGVEW